MSAYKRLMDEDDDVPEIVVSAVPPETQESNLYDDQSQDESLGSFNLLNPDDDSLTRKQSIALPQLHDSEKRFFDLVSAGNVEAVRDFLNRTDNFNMNCTDFQGVSALHIALRKNNEKMVEFLLAQPSMDVHDCALHAVRNNQPNILNLILNKIKAINEEMEFSPCIDSPEFPDNVTPLMLAAQCGHYEIIGLLIERNHTIMRPHRPHCFCREECLFIMASQDPLNTAAGRLEIYKAICNPAYICHTSDDPLLTSFHLVRELRELAAMYMIFHKQYEELAHATQMFAVDLIASCRSSEEVEMILNQYRGSRLRGDFQFPRLVLAMDFKQKHFVAQTNVQQVLESTWIGTWYKWKSFSKAVKTWYAISRIAILPFVITVCLFMPGSAWAQHYSLPINRMLNYLATYLIFLLLLYLHSDGDKKGQTHAIDFTAVDGFLFVFIISYIFSSARMCVIHGPKRYFRFKWNLYDIITHMVLLSAFMFLFGAYFTVDVDNNLERKYWHFLDPQLLAEGFFSFGTVMSFLRLLFMCQLNYNIGPLQKLVSPLLKVLENFRAQQSPEQKTQHTLPKVREILAFLTQECVQVEDAHLSTAGATVIMFRASCSTAARRQPHRVSSRPTSVAYHSSPAPQRRTNHVSLGKMTGDCGKFSVIFGIIIISFTAGLCHLYQYYDGMKQIDPESGVESRQESSFVSSFDTFKVLFWGLFCMSSQDAAEVVVENLPSDSEDVLGPINEHSFTEAVGYSLFASYMVLVVVVILNMLIATMSNTFQRVTDNVDVEWVFGRTEVYLLFMSQTVLPPPFNLLPVGDGTGFMSKICGRFIPGKVLKNKKVTNEEFALLMSQLLIRYFKEKETKVDDKAG